MIMNEPQVRFDGRFSDPKAEATPWSTTREVLESAQLSWLTTVRADGRPHITPLVAVWQDGALHFCTGPGEQKALNLTRQQQVALTTGSNTWSEGLDVVVEGTARRVTDRPTLERLAAAWATRWDGDWQYLVSESGFTHDGSGEAWVFAVEPSKVITFAKGMFGQTVYRP
jgi:nitroimidazol reductase NimA-like FMN-containing flavoprotein (pyridoxamine 5'-phosphate oxidase superfamily)